MKHKTQNGVTLMELLMTITIAAILIGIGAPGVASYVRSSRITSAINDLIVATTLARSEAIKRRAPVTICVSANATAAAPNCQTGAGTLWENGWVVFADTNGDAVINAGETILLSHAALNAQIDIRTDAALATYVSFSRAGLTRSTANASLTGNLVFCDDRGITDVGNDTSTARALTISRTGRAQAIREQSKIVGMSITCP